MDQDEVDKPDERQVWIPDLAKERKLTRKEETTDRGCWQLYLIRKHLIERKNASKKVRLPVETKGENGLNAKLLLTRAKRRYSKKRCANHDVWKLMNAGKV
jgi:hypothetical protein